MGRGRTREEAEEGEEWSEAVYEMLLRRNMEYIALCYIDSLAIWCGSGVGPSSRDTNRGCAPSSYAIA